MPRRIIGSDQDRRNPPRAAQAPLNITTASTSLRHSRLELFLSLSNWQPFRYDNSALRLKVETRITILSFRAFLTVSHPDHILSVATSGGRKITLDYWF